jgi:hypothetical protein
MCTYFYSKHVIRIYFMINIIIFKLFINNVFIVVTFFKRSNYIIGGPVTAAIRLSNLARYIKYNIFIAYI